MYIIAKTTNKFKMVEVAKNFKDDYQTRIRVLGTF